MPPRLAAKQGDKISALDMHWVQRPSSAPILKSFEFQGELKSDLSDNVFIQGRAAATKGSVAQNIPPHIAKSGTFVNPPSNEGRIAGGSASVFINGKPAARDGDTAETCDDRPGGNRKGKVRVESGSVYIGG